MCKEFKQVREEVDEVVEFDCGNIIFIGQKVVILNGKIEQ